MLTVQPFSGSLQELRERWREFMPLLAHSTRPMTFDDGTLQLAVLGRMGVRQLSCMAYQTRTAVAVIDGVAVRRVRCRYVSHAMWESLL